MKKVLLTGISGFVGQHCAVELLKSGYAVKGSLRNLKKSEKITEAISKELDPKGQLEYCELDLLSDKGWNDAVQGCDYVMHVASPFVSKIPKDDNELIRPAVEGTKRALEAAHKAGISRVVLTSSMVAMLGDVKGDKHISQQSWTNTKAKHATAYIKSKTMAEKAAWDFVKDKEMELVTIHPGPVYGPTLSGDLSGESMSLMKRLLKGQIKQMPHAAINMSDVRDVAKLHVLALENKTAANQRFVVATPRAYSYQELTEALNAGGYEQVSSKTAPTFMVKLLAMFNGELKGMLPYVGKTYEADISSTQSTFDWSPVPFDKMMLDTAKSVSSFIK